jgi:hypothetical protein
MADNTNPFGDARSAQQFSRDFSRYMEDAMNSYFAGRQFQGMRNNMASQSSMSDRVRGQNKDTDGWNFNPNSNRPGYRSSRGFLDDFEKGFTKEMLDALAGGDFKQNINKALTDFSKTMGFDISELGSKLGQQMAKQAMQSNLGQQVSGAIKNALVGEKGNGGALGHIGDFLGDIGNADLKNLFNQMVGDVFNTGAGAVTEAAGGVAEASAITEGSLATLGATGEAAGAGIVASEGALAGMATAVSTALPPILVALAAIAVAAEIAGPALEGLADVTEALGAAAFRSDTERAKRREAAEKRLTDDINYMVEQPFKILNEAATEWYNAWDNNLRTIGQTQGYDKEAVYSLYSSYAERLRDEGLSSVISSTSVIDGLKQVLSTGLSGQAAEEFAYVATKLNNAIPNQDFFQYAGTYAQIASNAIAQGASQAEALNLANEQLESFANNVLYASRELAGGFSTGLTNASQLFTDAVNIAQAARTGNATEISGTLTSVSAVLGAVAPDLAQGLVQNIVNAAVGGNSESIVALRSLAGINASNTEFLRAFAEDPQSVFSALFNKLAELQTMSNDNFMEVAEGLAPIFGVDMAALARVDFSYLANAITEMNTNSGALAENMELLASGQTTTTAEQAKMAEINQMILDDGLGIVLDNEAARVIQEHMWQEQQTVAITSATYSVEIKGALLHLVEGIAETVTNIIRFLNPIGAINEALENIAETADDMATQREALNQILERGAISINAEQMRNLTNYSGSRVLDIFNEGINDSNHAATISTRLLGMLFGSSASNSAVQTSSATALSVIRALSPALALNSLNPTAEDLVTLGGNIFANATSYSGSGRSSRGANSQYGWGTVGKTSARFLAAISNSADAYAGQSVAAEIMEQATKDNKDKFATLLGTISEANLASINLGKNAEGKFETGKGVEWGSKKTYDQWVKESFGDDRDAYLEAISAYGTTEEKIKGQFQAYQAQAQAQVSEARAQAESDFYADARNAIEEMRKYWGYETSAEGVYKSNIWQPYMDFWDISRGNYRSQFWTPFFEDNMKFDQGILKIFNEMENERDNWIGAPTNEGTVRGLLHTINATLIAFNDSFNAWVQEWTDFYINHTTYTERTTSADWNELLNMEQATRDDTSLAIANALEAISNIEDLKDPTVQQNVLLAKIVVLLEAIMQQNNSTGGLALPDSLSALGLGIVTRT